MLPITTLQFPPLLPSPHPFPPLKSPFAFTSPPTHLPYNHTSNSSSCFFFHTSRFREVTKSATIALRSMAREIGDPTAVGSSIVLLQERFRQLQKMKEKREGRELLKLFSESEQITTTPSKCSDPERTIYPSRPTPRDSLSLELDLYSKHADFQPVQTPPSTNLWSAGAAKVSKSYSYEKSDVDTSLHL